MKKLLSLFLSMLILFLSVIYVNAAATSQDSSLPDYVFSVESGAGDSVVYGVYKYTGTKSRLKIPDTANGYTVKYIDENVFYKNSVITNVVLNDNITQIRQWAFRNCANLKSVYCPPTLAVVWRNAFSYCPQIDSLLLKNTCVENFYESVFMGDSSLKYVSLPPTTKSIGYGCFWGTAVKSINIPDGTTTIGNSAFANNSKLKEVFIPSSVTTLGTSLFDGSENVTVYCEADSSAHQYCLENNIAFQLISKSDFPVNKLGDVDNSGDVDINDVTAIQKELARLETEFNVDNCDINKDCSFTISDATHLQRVLVQLESME